MSVNLGLFFHYINRVIAIAVSRYWAWTLESYLSRKAGKCGSIKFAGHGRFTNISKLEIGHNVHVNSGAYWVCEGGLTIGDNTIFARNVTIYTRNHDHRGSELPFDHSNVFRPVFIGRNVWVGANVTILPGAHIGDGAIIGAGAVVAGEIPQCAIVGAPKAQPIGHRDLEHYQKLDEAGAYHRPVYLPRR
ncbi:acyltransferase [Novosphingobium sp. BL-8A]|uniref:acyltransferase n=1 Tax=Novosphingobium sp. BL-8A TaxID=3127639 RepID=UPI003756AA3A